MKDQKLINNAIDALRNILKDVAFVELAEDGQQSTTAEPCWDWQIRLRLPDQQIWLLVEVKNTGEPRFARAAANQLLRYQDALPGSYGIFIAPWISPAAAQICKEAGVGYVDLVGNCRLTFGTIHINRAGRPNPFTEKRTLRSLYSPKAARVLRVLLSAPRHPWKLQSLANEAQVSLGQVHKVKNLLMDREWLQVELDGIILNKPAELLAAWAQNYSYRRNGLRQYYTLESPVEVENNLSTICTKLGIRYALAAFSAASRLAPFVRYQRAYAYVQEEAVQELLLSLQLKEVSSGANLALWIPYDEGIWYGMREVGGANVTSAVQTYLDLQSMHERGGEAASFLLEQVIRPLW